ncbi:S8 family serine peptidase [Rhodococcus aerolatus]
MRRRLTLGAGTAAAALALGLLAVPAQAAGTADTGSQVTTQADVGAQYAVLFTEGTSAAAGRAAVEAAGGTVLAVNEAIGEATVRADRGSFLTDVAAAPELAGAARNTIVGQVPGDARADRQTVERLESERAAAQGPSAAAAPGVPAAEPLGYLQWDNQQIGATQTGSYARDRGDSRVMVGVMDTGVDGSHPDIAPNFDAALSRNFTTDIPEIDGPCAEDPDGSCSDPADVDEDGHGTHVAGTIGAALNGIGISGVAPDVTLVNVRAGQDSGYFFLQSVVDALTYSADVGIDVVNMSFYIDPWLFNCANNPADSPAEQMEQRTVIASTQRAIDYAWSRGVTLVAAEGNGNTDLGKPVVDETSPDFPPGAERTRTVDNTCLNMPTEANHVISVTSTGASERKAYYSDYGVEQADLSAPGGDYYDPAVQVGASTARDPRNLVLSAYPKALALANGDIDADGNPTTPFVVVDQGATYQYLQGTSMASPHAAGVAALVVSKLGFPDVFRGDGGLTLFPGITELVLNLTARDHACPTPATFSYPGLSDVYTATCEGSTRDNGFYGTGIVDAGAVSRLPFGR